MVYPLRGEWTFRNVRRSFLFYPTLDTIEITQEHPDMSATLSCEVVADAGAHPEYDFQIDDEVRFHFAGTRRFGGHLTSVVEDRVEEFGPRKWRLEANDYTAKLGDAIIRQREQRKKESALRRVRWILSYLPHAWHLDGRDLEVPSEDLEREDMYGMSVAEALDSVANECGIRFWVDAENVLHVHKATTIDAPFALDNDAPDYVDSFPFREFNYERDGIDRRNAILVEPEKRKDSRWSVASANIADYEYGDSTGRRELFISDEEIRTARAAERHGDTQLQRAKVPKTEAVLVCWQPGLWSSMNVSLTEALWDHDQTMRIVKVSITAVDPHDDDDTAYLRSELTLTNKPKRRTPKQGRVEGETADTTPQPVDRFTRTATPPTPTPGTAFSPTYGNARMKQQMVGGIVDGVYVPGVPSVATLTFVPNYSAEYAIDKIGFYNHPWPGSPCGPGLGWQDGWKVEEVWRWVTLPAQPAGTEGFFVTVRGDNASYQGAGYTHPSYLHASLTPPSGLNSGTRIGTFPAGDTTNRQMYVPAAFVPAGGGDMWLGFMPGWFPPHNWSPGFFCYGDPSPELALSGHRAGFHLTAWAWATAGSPIDLGSAGDSPEAAPWGEQTWPWEVVGTTGGTTGIDGEALYVTDGGTGISLAGQGEDEDAAWGPWASPYMVELEVSVTGDIADAGERSIEVTTEGTGTTTIGTLSFGSATADPSITVAGPGSTDTAAVDLDPDARYRVSFDSRSGEFVGKVWAVLDGEPADVDVITTIDETDGEGDRFTIWLRGIEAGGAQTVRVHSVEMAAQGSSGDRVDHEWLGYASGLTERFRNRQRYRPGTLVAHVNGIDAVPIWEDGLYFRLDTMPTGQSGMHTSYTVE